MLPIALLMSFAGGINDSHTSTGGAPNGHSGDPSASGKTCNTAGCHTGATVGTLAGVITSTVPGTGYTAGNTYTITVSFVRPGHVKFGFQATPQNASGTKLGTLANLTSGTQIPAGSGGKYITHTNSSVSGTGGSRTWNFLWTAPATGLGPVTFYGAFNATNNNNLASGDSIFKSTLVLTEASSAVHDLYTDEFSLSAFPNPAHDNLQVKFNTPASSSAEIELWDMAGNRSHVLFSKTAVSGEINEAFDLSSYSKGIYFLRLNVDGRSSVQKIIKL